MPIGGVKCLSQRLQCLNVPVKLHETFQMKFFFENVSKTIMIIINYCDNYTIDQNNYNMVFCCYGNLSIKIREIFL